MDQGSEGDRAPLKHTRQVTIDALMEHFANDVMEMDEFERRLDVANAATSSEELKELLRDLPRTSNLPAPTSGAGAVAGERPGYSVTSESSLKEREIVVAVMGGSSRRGRWTPARTNYAVAVMGGTELDFREAVLGPGVTEVRVFTVWGGVEIVVPPGLNVESHGVAIMGGFEHNAEGAGPHDPMAPTLRITGAAIMAGVDISVRHTGESARDARRRTRLEKREQRRRLRGG